MAGAWWHVVGGGVEAGGSMLAQLASTQGQAQGDGSGPVGATAGDRRWVGGCDGAWMRMYLCVCEHRE